MPSNSKSNKVSKSYNGWAGTARDIALYALELGQLPLLFVLAIIGLFVWRYPETDLPNLSNELLTFLKVKSHYGWVLSIVFSSGWIIHFRYYRRFKTEELERVTEERNRLQKIVHGDDKIGSSNE